MHEPLLEVEIVRLVRYVLTYVCHYLVFLLLTEVATLIPQLLFVQHIPLGEPRKFSALEQYI
jgi:hypothetical protein